MKIKHVFNMITTTEKPDCLKNGLCSQTINYPFQTNGNNVY